MTNFHNLPEAPGLRRRVSPRHHGGQRTGPHRSQAQDAVLCVRRRCQRTQCVSPAAMRRGLAAQPASLARGSASRGPAGRSSRFAAILCARTPASNWQPLPVDWRKTRHSLRFTARSGGPLLRTGGGAPDRSFRSLQNGFQVVFRVLPDWLQKVTVPASRDRFFRRSNMGLR